MGQYFINHFPHAILKAFPCDIIEAFSEETDVKSLDHCPLCKSDTGNSGKPLFKSTDYISGDTFSILRCGKCGFIFTDSYPDQEDEFGRYYPKEEYYGSDEGRRFISPMEKMIFAFRVRRARRVLDLKSKGCVLDIGCGRGLLLQLLKSRGWECHGTELSEPLALRMRENHGIDVRACSIQDCNFADKMFDAVSIYHVLEHISDPKGVLQEVRRIIKNDGMLIIGVPNIASFQSVISGPKWFHLDIPRHVAHFSPGTLKQMVEECGFEIVSAKSFSAEYDPYGLIQSVLNALGCRKNFLYELLRSKKVERINVKTLFYDLPISLLLSVILLIPSIALEFILSLFQRNGTLEILCRPALTGSFSDDRLQYTFSKEKMR